MTKLGTLKLTGDSGQTYAFDVYQSNANFNDGIACVYYVSKRTEKQDGGGGHKAIYVGETEDLADRFSSHHKQTCFNNHDYNAISIHKVSSKDRRTEIEADLVEAINPPCND